MICVLVGNLFVFYFIVLFLMSVALCKTRILRRMNICCVYFAQLFCNRKMNPPLEDHQ